MWWQETRGKFFVSGCVGASLAVAVAVLYLRRLRDLRRKAEEASGTDASTEWSDPQLGLSFRYPQALTLSSCHVQYPIKMLEFSVQDVPNAQVSIAAEHVGSVPFQDLVQRTLDDVSHELRSELVPVDGIFVKPATLDGLPAVVLIYRHPTAAGRRRVFAVLTLSSAHLFIVSLSYDLSTAPDALRPLHSHFQTLLLHTSITPAAQPITTSVAVIPSPPPPSLLSPLSPPASTPTGLDSPSAGSPSPSAASAVASITAASSIAWGVVVPSPLSVAAYRLMPPLEAVAVSFGGFGTVMSQSSGPQDLSSRAYADSAGGGGGGPRGDTYGSMSGMRAQTAAGRHEVPPGEGEVFDAAWERLSVPTQPSVHDTAVGSRSVSGSGTSADAPRGGVGGGGGRVGSRRGVRPSGAIDGGGVDGGVETISSPSSPLTVAAAPLCMSTLSGRGVGSLGGRADPMGTSTGVGVDDRNLLQQSGRATGRDGGFDGGALLYLRGLCPRPYRVRNVGGDVKGRLNAAAVCKLLVDDRGDGSRHGMGVTDVTDEAATTACSAARAQAPRVEVVPAEVVVTVGALASASVVRATISTRGGGVDSLAQRVAAALEAACESALPAAQLSLDRFLRSAGCQEAEASIPPASRCLTVWHSTRTATAEARRASGSHPAGSLQSRAGGGGGAAPDQPMTGSFERDRLRTSTAGSAGAPYGSLGGGSGGGGSVDMRPAAGTAAVAAVSSLACRRAAARCGRPWPLCVTGQQAHAPASSKGSSASAVASPRRRHVGSSTVARQSGDPRAPSSRAPPPSDVADVCASAADAASLLNPLPSLSDIRSPMPCGCRKGQAVTAATAVASSATIPAFATALSDPASSVMDGAVEALSQAIGVVMRGGGVGAGGASPRAAVDGAVGGVGGTFGTSVSLPAEPDLAIRCDGAVVATLMCDIHVPVRSTSDLSVKEGITGPGVGSQSQSATTSSSAPVQHSGRGLDGVRGVDGLSPAMSRDVPFHLASSGDRQSLLSGGGGAAGGDGMPSDGWQIVTAAHVVVSVVVPPLFPLPEALRRSAASPTITTDGVVSILSSIHAPSSACESPASAASASPPAVVGGVRPRHLPVAVVGSVAPACGPSIRCLHRCVGEAVATAAPLPDISNFSCGSSSLQSALRQFKVVSSGVMGGRSAPRVPLLFAVRGPTPSDAADTQGVWRERASGVTPPLMWMNVTPSSSSNALRGSMGSRGSSVARSEAAAPSPSAVTPSPSPCLSSISLREGVDANITPATAYTVQYVIKDVLTMRMPAAMLPSFPKVGDPVALFRPRAHGRGVAPLWGADRLCMQVAEITLPFCVALRKWPAGCAADVSLSSSTASSKAGDVVAMAELYASVAEGYGGRFLRDSHRLIHLPRVRHAGVKGVFVELTQWLDGATSAGGGGGTSAMKYLTIVVPPTDSHDGFLLEFAAAAEHTLVLARVLEVVLPSVVLL